MFSNIQHSFPGVFQRYVCDVMTFQTPCLHSSVVQESTNIFQDRPNCCALFLMCSSCKTCKYVAVCVRLFVFLSVLRIAEQWIILQFNVQLNHFRLLATARALSSGDYCNIASY